MSFNISFNLQPEKAVKKMQQAAAEGLLDAGDHLQEHANRTVPHDEGTLERSSSVWPDTVGGIIDEDLVVYVSYDTPYARRLHESEPGEYKFRGKGRRKWLERALQERQKAMRDHIIKGMRDEMRT